MGLNSPGSDYDVRGVVVRRFVDYVSLDEPLRKLDSWSVEQGELDLQVTKAKGFCVV
jgi:predicted nucleotidyltransferase